MTKKHNNKKYGFSYEDILQYRNTTKVNSESKEEGSFDLMNLGAPHLDYIAALWTGDSEEFKKELKIYKQQKEEFEKSTKDAFIKWLEKRKKYDN
jgi:hypothetical protein